VKIRPKHSPDKVHWWDLVNTAMELRLPYKVKVLVSSQIAEFCKRALMIHVLYPVRLLVWKQFWGLYIKIHRSNTLKCPVRMSVVTTATLTDNFRSLPQVNSERVPNIRPRSLFSHPFQITVRHHQITERYPLLISDQ
jgi:hypothetical protein